MMWKPGTAKPDTNTTTTPISKQPNQGTNPKTGGSSSKKLSNATMGMRFMQRKAADSSNNNKQQYDDEENAANKSSQNSNSTLNDGNFERKRDHTAISSSSSPTTTTIKPSLQSSSNDNSTILQLASVVDMYGIGSDIIGRRSFGGFHNSVRMTWDTALKQRTDSAAMVNNTKSHITDEELLERYEKYVKGGRGGGGGGGERKDGGRDKRKQKRKR
ncbi:hypothetical protein ACHAXM_006030 [Skeletonema potamos]